MKKIPITIAIATSLLVGTFYLFPNNSNAAHANVVNKGTKMSQPSRANSTSNSVMALPQWHGQLSVAKNNGELAPSSIKFVKTSRQKANQFVSKSTVDSDVGSYLVVMHGNFTMQNSFGPPGSNPTRHTLSFIVDSAKGTMYQEIGPRYLV